MSAEPDMEPPTAREGGRLLAAVPTTLTLIGVAIEVYLLVLLVSLPFDWDGRRAFAAGCLAPFVLVPACSLFMEELSARPAADPEPVGRLRALSADLWVRLAALLCGLLMLGMIALVVVTLRAAVADLADGIEAFDVVALLFGVMVAVCGGLLGALGLFVSTRFLVGGRHAIRRPMRAGSLSR